MTVGELIDELSKFDKNMEVGSGDDFGALEPIRQVCEETVFGPPYVRLEIVEGAREVD